VVVISCDCAWGGCVCAEQIEKASNRMAMLQKATIALQQIDL
jgi:hypothetical protein